MNRPRFEATEEQTQQVIRDWCRCHGYLCFQTTHRVRRCLKCGEYPRQAAYGTDPGIPDLIITHVNWPPYIFLGMEVKSRRGTLTPEQRVLREGERIVIVRCLEDAIESIKQFEQGAKR